MRNEIIIGNAWVLAINNMQGVAGWGKGEDFVHMINYVDEKWQRNSRVCCCSSVGGWRIKVYFYLEE